MLVVPRERTSQKQSREPAQDTLAGTCARSPLRNRSWKRVVPETPRYGRPESAFPAFSLFRYSKMPRRITLATEK